MRKEFVCTASRGAVPFTKGKVYSGKFDDLTGLWEAISDFEQMPYYIEEYKDHFAILGGGYGGKAVQLYAEFKQLK